MVQFSIKWKTAVNNIGKKGIRQVKRGRAGHPIFVILDENEKQIGRKLSLTNEHEGQIGEKIFRQWSSDLRINDVEFVAGFFRCENTQTELLQRLRQNGIIS
jgi:hypothetical protein